MADDTTSTAGALSDQLATLELRTRDLEIGAGSFARSMTSAFTSAITSGQDFDDVLQSLTLRLSDLALRMAFAPITRGLTSGIESLFSGLFGATAGSAKELTSKMADVKLPAGGGVLGAASYLPSGSNGVFGAGADAAAPFMAVSSRGNQVSPSVTINIATPDMEGFRRSESYVTGQIARAVARGQRGF